ncbi:MAG: hypothetical protein ACREB3_17670, partial [Burkholderiales bacterium]
MPMHSAIIKSAAALAAAALVSGSAKAAPAVVSPALGTIARAVADSMIGKAGFFELKVIQN